MIDRVNRSPSQCLQILIEKIFDIQALLPSEYRKKTILRNKLFDAVKEVSFCQFAHYNPANTVQDVI